MIDIVDGLVFDDVLLIPKHSKIKSRADVDLSVNIWKGFKFKHPIVPANMKTTVGFEMAKTVIETGGMAILHRFMPLEEQLEIARKFALLSQEGKINYTNYMGYSIGVKESDKEAIKALVQVGMAKIICIDVAHGDSEQCVEMCNFISRNYPKVLLIAGNVATGEAAKRLWLAGADVVKVGVGSGSICSTRIETGNGVPQLSALIDVFDARKELTSIVWPMRIISDGGCNKPADVCKALCFADMVMVGGMVAGTEECPTTKIEQDGKFYSRYDGSSTYKGSRIEGVEAMVPYKGSVNKVFDRIFDGIQSCCSYQGVSNLIDLKLKPKFTRITNNGLKESGIHDVIQIPKGI